MVELAVAEGQLVEAGELLSRIRTEEDIGQDLSSAQRIEQATARRDASQAIYVFPYQRFGTVNSKLAVNRAKFRLFANLGGQLMVLHRKLHWPKVPYVVPAECEPGYAGKLS